MITTHLRNIFAECELEAGSACANFAHTAEDGKTHQVKHYNLEVIISLGCPNFATQADRSSTTTVRASGGAVRTAGQRTIGAHGVLLVALA